MKKILQVSVHVDTKNAGATLMKYNARFHVTWFNIDSLPHANRTTLHHTEVALQGGKFL